MAAIRNKLDLSGRRVLVSGASGGRGIGSAIARAFHELGAYVVNLDVADGAGLLPDRYEFHKCDMTDESAVRRAVQTAAASCGGLDTLVNNAGVIAKADMEAFDMAEFERVLRVNTLATAQLTKHCIPFLKRSRAGRIVSIASVQAYIGTPVYSAYTASKAAVCGLTRVWAMELIPFGINVNAICPGFVHTDMFEKGMAKIMADSGATREEAMAKIVAGCPQKRPLKPEEIGELAVLLGSELLPGLTGQSIHLDGGMVL